GALRPAVPAHRGTARDLHAQVQHRRRTGIAGRGRAFAHRSIVTRPASDPNLFPDGAARVTAHAGGGAPARDARPKRFTAAAVRGELAWLAARRSVGFLRDSAGA